MIIYDNPVPSIMGNHFEGQTTRAYGLSLIDMAMKSVHHE